ncbi:hypothetical protein V2K91_21405 [Pseudomonas alliivorans]|nr:hypothetical protein [Pseudomonas alliivorans]
MSKDEDGSSVSSVIDAVTGLAKAMPIYEDMVQPAIKRICKSFESIGKLINATLAPFGLLISVNISLRTAS